MFWCGPLTRKAEFARPVPLSFAAGLHHGDFRVLADAIEDASADLVLTDPPYAEPELYAGAVVRILGRLRHAAFLSPLCRVDASSRACKSSARIWVAAARHGVAAVSVDDLAHLGVLQPLAGLGAFQHLGAGRFWRRRRGEQIKNRSRQCFHNVETFGAVKRACTSRSLYAVESRSSGGSQPSP